MEELLNALLRLALQYRVTDIHFELNPDDTLKIEMRVNGIMYRLKPGDADGSFFRYLMYRANLDLSNALEPQTGSFTAEVDGQKLSLRFALIASFSLTSGVLRILNNHDHLQVRELSPDPEVCAWLSSLTRPRSGLCVLSGPTGSGKTTTLYTLLNHTEGRKIYTLEDPVEVYSEKYIQIQINDRQHMSYAEGIRQLLRHDPDIIMIGEIRDTEAAAMAVRTALTGHLVLTTLHASSCILAIDRLLDLGIPEYQLRDVLSAVSCQRLYDSGNGTRIGLYEIMDRKEVTYYFTHHQTSPSFRPLAARIAEAVAAGLVEPDQAAADLSG